MNILAIDPATVCGWATSDGNYGTWDLSIRKDESAGMKWLRFQSKLHTIRKNYIDGIQVVVYERPGGRHAGALIHHAKLVGILESFCADMGIEYRGYSASEIKKLATGKGNASKQDVLLAAQTKLNYVGDDYNEADALWLLELVKRDLL